MIEGTGSTGWSELTATDWSNLTTSGWSGLGVSAGEQARVTWTYDPTGQLLTEARSGANAYRTTYVYDPSGNRQVEITETNRTTSVYDGANRLLTSNSFSGNTTYSYDPAGNRTRLETPALELTTYTWNAENQLTQIELPAGDVVTHVWSPINKNAEERIVEQDDGVTVTRFLWDNNNVVRETDDVGAVEAEYTYRPEPFGDLVSQRRDTDSSFYRFDALGSTTGLTDDTGAVTDDYRYQAFGGLVEATGSTENAYRWVGQIGYRQEEATGLYNLRAREYDPTTGTFVSQDPFGLAAGDSNFYRYVRNDAVTSVDPSGNKNSQYGPSTMTYGTGADAGKVFVECDLLGVLWGTAGRIRYELGTLDSFDHITRWVLIQDDKGNVVFRNKFCKVHRLTVLQWIASGALRCDNASPMADLLFASACSPNPQPPPPLPKPQPPPPLPKPPTTQPPQPRPAPARRPQGVWICYRQFGGDTPQEIANYCYAFENPQLGMFPRSAHAYIVITLQNGKTISYSFHPNEWPNGFIDAMKERPGRVWISDPSDLDVANGVGQLRGHCYQIPTRPGDPERLNAAIVDWIKDSGVAVDVGRPIGEGGKHGDPSQPADPNTKVKYYVHKYNCAWWAQFMLTRVNLTIPDAVATACRQYNFNTGPAQTDTQRLRDECLTCPGEVFPRPGSP